MNYISNTSSIELLIRTNRHVPSLNETHGSGEQRTTLTQVKGGMNNIGIRRYGECYVLNNSIIYSVDRECGLSSIVLMLM